MSATLTERKAATRALNLLAAGGIILVLVIAATAAVFAA